MPMRASPSRSTLSARRACAASRCVSLPLSARAQTVSSDVADSSYDLLALLLAQVLGVSNPATDSASVDYSLDSLLGVDRYEVV